MTHDELLTKLADNYQLADYAELRGEDGFLNTHKALRAVVELHKPVEITTGVSYTQENGLEVLATQAICAFCKDMGAIEHLYPCPTIQVVEKELGVE